jgi:hypothetical protein
MAKIKVKVFGEYVVRDKDGNKTPKHFEETIEVEAASVGKIRSKLRKDKIIIDILRKKDPSFDFLRTSQVELPSPVPAKGKKQTQVVPSEDLDTDLGEDSNEDYTEDVDAEGEDEAEEPADTEQVLETKVVEKLKAASNKKKPAPKKPTTKKPGKKPVKPKSEEG